MRKSTMILGTVFLIMAMLAALFLAGGTLSAKVETMTAIASDYPKAYASIKNVLAAGAPQEFSEALPEDPSDCRLEDVTITLSNRGLFPAEWISVNVEGAPGDVAVYSITGEGSNIPGRSVGTVNLKLVSLAEAAWPRVYHIQYYVFGMKRSIDVRTESDAASGG